MPRAPTGHPKKPIWTYAYKIVPSQSEQRLRAVKTLIESENTGAKLEASTFEARFVLERQITDILVVTDSPDQQRDVNRRMEAELDRLNVKFTVTVPLAVGDDDDGPEAGSRRDPK